MRKGRIYVYEDDLRAEIETAFKLLEEMKHMIQMRWYFKGQIMALANILHDENIILRLQKYRDSDLEEQQLSEACSEPERSEEEKG